MKKVIFSALLFLVTIVAFSQSKQKITLVIHGGAGTITRANLTPEKEQAYRSELELALKTGYKILENGGTSIDAVEATIRIMEDSPLFNAGKGAVFTHDGKNALDAAIMDGKTLMAGTVADVGVIKNPISAAKAVMQHSEHVMLIGKGAEEFAKSNNLEIVDPSYFYTENRWNALQKALKEDNIKLDHADTLKKSGYLNTDPKNDFIFDEGKKFGTVGCVALDQYGNLAAGTSTGGMTNKKWGRIGDSPIVGAGTYANNNTCAVSATGHGEFFIRSVAAYDISALMEYKHLTVQQAADEVVMKKLVKLKGEGGVIALDKNGNYAMPFNSEGMYRGVIKSDGKPKVSIYKN